jgi:hypothetical protein
MISEVQTSKGSRAITSDGWHVVHGRCTREKGKTWFVRAVSSEHENREECVRAARALRRKLAADHADRPAAERDEVLVRRPNFKSLERARQRHARPK